MAAGCRDNGKLQPQMNANETQIVRRENAAPRRCSQKNFGNFITHGGCFQR
jgi:hypothetical protein